MTEFIVTPWEIYDQEIIDAMNAFIRAIEHAGDILKTVVDFCDELFVPVKNPGRENWKINNTYYRNHHIFQYRASPKKKLHHIRNTI